MTSSEVTEYPHDVISCVQTTRIHLEISPLSEMQALPTDLKNCINRNEYTNVRSNFFDELDLFCDCMDETAHTMMDFSAMEDKLQGASYL